MRIELPLANGIRTDHPVPNLPFVDDSHLPIHDGKAIQAHGRHDYNAGWGRYDSDQTDRRRWCAFTNDQFNLSFSWVVRHDPGFGRTVLLYASGDETLMHDVSPHDGDPLLFRAGGYWWDGKSWHRPSIIFDRATERDVAVPVSDAVSITAADYMTTDPGNSDKGRIADITSFVPGTVKNSQWTHDLALWAARRPQDGQPLEQCVVDVVAGELEWDALMSKSTAASFCGLSRDEMKEALSAPGSGRASRFPFPQRHTPTTGSPRWSKPVLQDWLWERQRDRPEPVVEHLRRDIACPDADQLLYTITSAALWRMKESYDPVTQSCAFGLPLERMIGWVVTEQPQLAEALFGDIVRSARDQLDLPDGTIEETLRDAVRFGIPEGDEDKDDSGALDEFLRRTLPPSLGI